MKYPNRRESWYADEHSQGDQIMPCKATRLVRHTTICTFLVLLGGGCKYIPARPAEPTRPSESVALGSSDKEPELPPLPVLRSIADEEAFQPAPTPILDAAAERDEAVKKALAEKMVADSAQPTTPLPDFKLVRDTPADPPEPRPAPQVEPASFVPPMPELPKPETSERLESPPPAPIDPESSLWNYVLSALATASISEPEASMPPAPEFRISNLRMCKRVLGFGRIEPIDEGDLRSGRHVLLYCEIEGVHDEECAQGYRARIASSLAILPASGGDPVWQFDLGSAEDHCQSRRRDFFVNYRITIPKNLPPGNYELRLVQKDLLGGREASKSLPLTVHSK